MEFLQIQPDTHVYEGDLEQALIDHLQHFLLELGRGFSFVARQKIFTLDGQDFFIDLVFYNYILKCFVLIDLKMGKLTHQPEADIHCAVFCRNAEGFITFHNLRK